MKRKRQGERQHRHPGEEGRNEMSCFTKTELENMLEDVVNELGLSKEVIENHGPLGTPPAKLVRMVLAEKDMKIKMLKQGFVEVSHD